MNIPIREEKEITQQISSVKKVTLEQDTPQTQAICKTGIMLLYDEN